MRIIVLGAAAGGGFPQWNCNCANCRLARAGSPRARPRTQSSLAVSRDGERWFLLNCSPDLRQQLLATAELWPRESPRHSPVVGALLTNADVDHVAGLLALREGQPLVLHATRRVLDLLDASRVFEVLDRGKVRRQALRLEQPTELAGPDGPAGIRATLFPVPGKAALWMEERGATPDLAAEGEETVGVAVEADGRSFFYVPGCAAVTPALASRLAGAALLLFDGTLWRDDEMLQAGVGPKTGRRMGHMSISGPEGSLAALAGLGIRRKVYVHLNNTNPVLVEDSPERAAVAAAGWEVAHDGMELSP